MKLLVSIIIIFLISVSCIQAQETSPSARCGHSMLSIGDTIYLFGGSTIFDDTISLNNSNHSKNAIKGDLLNDLWCYRNQEWDKIENSNTPPPERAYHSATTNGNRMMIFSGLDKYGNVHDDIWSYNIVTNEWEEKNWTGNYVAPKRYGHVAAEIDDFIYIFGVRNDRGNGSSTLYKYNPATGEGDVVPVSDFENHPKDLYGCSGWTQDGKLYIFGGFGGGDVKEYKNDIWEFDPATGLWKFITATGNKPSPRAFAQTVSGSVPLSSVRVFLIGGEKDGEQYKDSYMLNTTDWTWTKGTDALITRSRGGAGIINDSRILTKEPSTDSLKILLFGGVSNNIPIDSEEIYSFVLTGINESEGQLPAKFELYQNYPNPFNSTTTIKYSIPIVSPFFGGVSGGSSHVTLKIFDILGQETKTFVNKEQKPGNYYVEFNAAGLASGVYFYRLQIQNFSDVKKMIILK